MIDETVYHEYANWKLEHSELLEQMSKSGSAILSRFKHILDVVDFLYDKLIDDPNYTEEEDHIFKTGFYYIADQLEDIKQILDKVYGNELSQLEKHAKEVNLFLNAIDFQTELLNNELEADPDIDRLMVFDKDIIKLIQNKEAVPENYFKELDELTYRVFKKLNIDYYSISDIFLEIADEYEIL